MQICNYQKWTLQNEKDDPNTRKFYLFQWKTLASSNQDNYWWVPAVNESIMEW